MSDNSEKNSNWKEIIGIIAIALVAGGSAVISYLKKDKKKEETPEK